jgi:hypothetical protein
VHDNAVFVRLPQIVGRSALLLLLSGAFPDRSLLVLWQSASGNLTVCKTSFKSYVAAGHDKGSTLGVWPSDDAVVSMGKKVLGM